MTQKGGVNDANRFYKPRICAVCGGSILLIYSIYLIAHPPRLTRAGCSAYNKSRNPQLFTFTNYSSMRAERTRQQ